MGVDNFGFSTGKPILNKRQKASRRIMNAHETGTAKFGHQTAPESNVKPARGYNRKLVHILVRLNKFCTKPCAVFKKAFYYSLLRQSKGAKFAPEN